MGEVVPRDILTGFLVFTLFAVGAVAMISILGEGQSGMADNEKYQEFNSSFNKLQEVNSTIGSFKEGISEDITDWGAFGVLNVLVQRSWNTIKLFFTSFGFLDEAMTGLTKVFGIPGWIVTIIMGIMTVIIVFGIYSAVFQRKV